MIKRLGALLAAMCTVLTAVVFIAQPAQAATGFSISNGRLLDANGQDFVMRGINHPHAWYPGQTRSFANIKATGANTVRVVLTTASSASDVANVISLCKQHKLVCVLEVHDTTGLGDTAAITLSQAADYWVRIRSTLIGQEQFVIVNLGNEPVGNNNFERWTADTRGAIQKVRAAGITHTLMADGPNWGQDWSFTMRDNAAAIFASDPDRNVIFSIHMYGVFNTAAKVSDYLSRFVAAGLPILVGEFGHNHSDGDPDENAIMATARAQRLGYLGWSWSGNSATVGYLDMTTNFDPNRLTSWGERIINGTDGIRSTSRQASVY